MLFRKGNKIKRFGPAIKSSYPQIIFCDQKLELCQKVTEKFSEVDQIEIIHGDIFKVKTDALISPANSFGDMSGGIDRAIDNHYGGSAQKLLQHEIREEFFGELPVGMAILLEMGSSNFQYLIAAPTMRIPGILRKDSINVYLAMRAILVCALRYNEKHGFRIQKIAIPGLGTGVGGMDFEESARQMYGAYGNIYEDKWKQTVHPAIAPYVLSKG